MAADTLSLYAKLIGAAVRSQMQYRASFLLAALGVFLVTGIEAIGVWALFARFGRLQTWSLPEVALLFGTVNITFAIADSLAAGFDGFASQVRSGDFDRVLLRPRSTLLQLIGHDLALRRVGRLAQGLLIFVWAAAHLDLPWHPWHIALLLVTVMGGVCLFVGLMVLQATGAFWTVESLEVFSAFTHGGVTAAQYPMTIYAPWFRRFFTFVVPLALVTYFPMLAVLGREDPLGSTRPMQAAAPLAGVVFLALALMCWRLGVRRYTSTGS